MKIVISVETNSENARPDPSFGRCSYFALMDTDSDTIEFLPNQARESGSGVNAAAMVVKAGPDLIIVGNIGPKAYQVIERAGIPVYKGLKDTVRDTVAAHQRGETQKISAPTK